MKEKHPNFLDLTGKKFGRLKAIKDIGRDKSGSVLWECECDCGSKAVVTSRNLNHNHTKSCGCYHRDRMSETRTVHGLYYDENGKRSKLYRVWGSMKQRCNNPNDKGYKNYGGRGIKVCKEWEKYKNFHNWAIANGYEEGLTIDRINNDGDYEPSNCRWVTRQKQNLNTRYNRLLEYNGKTQKLTEWARETEIDSKVLGNRLRRGWSIERALTQPVRGRKDANKVK